MGNGRLPQAQGTGEDVVYAGGQAYIEGREMYRRRR